MPRCFTLVLALPLCLALGTHAFAQAGSKTDPNTCKQIWSEIGLPTPNPGAHHTTRVCHRGYITGHNDSNKTPDWVIEHLTPKLVNGDATREDQDFHADPALPEKARALPADYDGSGFDKGHNAPAADYHGDQDALDDTFFYSNAVPQVGKGFNRSIWRSLETLVRKLVAGDRPNLYVITGPVYQESKPIKVSSKTDVCKSNIGLPVPDRESICPENHKNKKAECTAGVAVPAGMYKIIYDAKSQTAFAVLFENMDHTGHYASGRTFDYIQAHRIGISTIEDLTGLKFFTALPDRVQRQMRSNCTDVKFH
jgi:endonuclease G